MFVTDKKIAEVAEDLLPLFEVGDLHSRTKVGKIAIHAKEALLEHGLPTRRSLCCVVANVALMTFRRSNDMSKPFCSHAGRFWQCSRSSSIALVTISAIRLYSNTFVSYPQSL